MCMKTIEHVLLCLFSPYLLFFVIDNQYFPTKFDNNDYLHEEPEHITYVRTYRSARTVLYVKTFFFFPLIVRLVCTIHSNQTLDALIKYVA